MAAIQPVSPDNDYCVYCHAVAAGPCAVCGAICCGDCVDLVMGLITRRAVCHTCLEQGRKPGDTRLRVWLTVALITLAATAGLLWAMTGKVFGDDRAIRLQRSDRRIVDALPMNRSTSVPLLTKEGSGEVWNGASNLPLAPSLGDCRFSVCGQVPPFEKGRPGGIWGMDCSKNPPPSPFFKGGSQKSFSLAASIDSPLVRRGFIGPTDRRNLAAVRR